MGNWGEGIGRLLAPVSIKLWPGIGNPAWSDARVAATVLGSALQVSVDPRRVRRKLVAEAVAPIKDRFLVRGLGDLPSEPIEALYTYMDLADIARFGDDLAATRLYKWLRASLDAGRPVAGRGQIYDSDAKIAAYCQVYLDLYRSLQRDGYRYSGDDEICLGIGAGGELLHIRRGTHRMAAAQILELPSVSARITHIDRAFAERAIGGGDVAAGLTKMIKEVVS